jgi:hypothetical protein
MFTSAEYMEMAKECLEEADRENDIEGKKALVGTARLYAEAAMDAPSACCPAELPPAQESSSA